MMLVVKILWFNFQRNIIYHSFEEVLWQGGLKASWRHFFVVVMNVEHFRDTF